MSEYETKIWKLRRHKNEEQFRLLSSINNDLIMSLMPLERQGIGGSWRVCLAVRQSLTEPNDADTLPID